MFIDLTIYLNVTKHQTIPSDQDHYNSDQHIKTIHFVSFQTIHKKKKPPLSNIQWKTSAPLAMSTACLRCVRKSTHSPFRANTRLRNPNGVVSSNSSLSSPSQAIGFSTCLNDDFMLCSAKSANKPIIADRPVRSIHQAMCAIFQLSALSRGLNHNRRITHLDLAYFRRGQWPKRTKIRSSIKARTKPSNTRSTIHSMS